VGSHKAQAIGSRSLAASKAPRALVLEGSLDDHLESTRSEEDLLRTWLESNDIPFAYKTVLTLEGLEVVGRAVGAKRPVFVHISCHGDYDNDRRPFITFAPKPRKADRIYLDEERVWSVFRAAFEGLPILFSACLLGRHEAPMKELCKRAKLKGIAAFTREVYDSEAMLFELLLYQGLLVRGWTFRTACAKARNALHLMGLKGGAGRGQAFVRVF
jgi:hypothetical protein